MLGMVATVAGAAPSDSCEELVDNTEEFVLLVDACGLNADGDLAAL
jgi:hypothetical protein